METLALDSKRATNGSTNPPTNRSATQLVLAGNSTIDCSGATDAEFSCTWRKTWHFKRSSPQGFSVGPSVQADERGGSIWCGIQLREDARFNPPSGGHESPLVNGVGRGRQHRSRTAWLWWFRARWLSDHGDSGRGSTNGREAHWRPCRSTYERASKGDTDASGYDWNSGGPSIFGPSRRNPIVRRRNPRHPKLRTDENHRIQRSQRYQYRCQYRFGATLDGCFHQQPISIDR